MMVTRNDTDASPGHPPGQPPAEAVQDVETLFEEWQAQEAHVDLSDLRWVDAVVFAVFWALFAVVFLQFWTRYVLNDSVGWTEEIARYLLIAVTFIGSATAMRKGSHIAVEAMLVYLPERARHWTLVVVDGLVALFTGAMAWYAYRLGALAPGYMISIDIPKAYMYWMVAVALAAMTVYAAARFRRRLKGREAAMTHGLTID